MVLKKVKVIDAQVLDEQEMKRIAGGVSRGDYCATLSWQWEYAQSNHWSIGAYEGWWYGWSTYCM